MLYRKGERVIGVGNLPNCKRKCLYVGSKYCIEKVASFSSDEQADKFEDYLCYFLGLNNEKDIDNASNV